MAGSSFLWKSSGIGCDVVDMLLVEVLVWLCLCRNV